MDQFDFYSSVSSFYGQKAQLALHVKGIKYKFHDIELMKLENLEPWYIRMNPKGLVPTLKHGHSVIPESDEILKFLDVHFTPRLQPNPHLEQGQRCQYYLEKLGCVPVESLTTGVMWHSDLTENCKVPASVISQVKEQIHSNTKQKVLRKHMMENPHLVGVYQAKLDAVNSDTPVSRERLDILLARCGALLQDVDDQLEKVESVYGDSGRWLVGENLCTADLVLTAFLFRLGILGLSQSLYETKLPRVQRYFQRSQQNMPGFSEVCLNFR